MIKVSKLKPNPQNPRVIRDAKFTKLKQSIQDFPEMMTLRPMVVSNGHVIGGNMRLKAIIDLGIKEVPDEWVKYEDLSEEKEKEFIIKDNVGFGEWEWDTLANEWDNVELGEWGLDVWQPQVEPDYSILEGEDLTNKLQDMTDGVKKAIQIEFEAEHYEEAYGLIKHFRDAGGYVGGMIMEFLKEQKAKG
jgi:hypothetical protein